MNQFMSKPVFCIILLFLDYILIQIHNLLHHQNLFTSYDSVVNELQYCPSNEYACDTSHYKKDKSQKNLQIQSLSLNA